MSALPAPEVMYQALVNRDVGYEGIFFVAVKTTRIFCRPGCTARTPKFENVEFFSRSTDALYSGYRPCKICRPLDPANKPPAWIADLMKQVESEPSRRWRDRDLRALELEPARVRRYFQTHFGMTFQAYSRSLRMGQALKTIREGKGVFMSGLDVGFDSDSGFRDAFEKVLGVPPSRSSKSQVLIAQWLESPLGALLAAASDEGLCLLEFVDRRMLPAQIETLKRRFEAAVIPGEHPILEQLKRELSEYFAGSRREFDVPLVIRGTAFQEKVWRHLLSIPYGSTQSYGEMAAALGSEGAQRAVGKANGDNRISILISCHRVIKADGTLCGYGGGLWRKKFLLELEGSERQASFGF